MCMADGALSVAGCPHCRAAELNPDAQAHAGTPWEVVYRPVAEVAGQADAGGHLAHLGLLAEGYDGHFLSDTDKIKEVRPDTTNRAWKRPLLPPPSPPPSRPCSSDSPLCRCGTQSVASIILERSLDVEGSGEDILLVLAMVCSRAYRCMLAVTRLRWIRHTWTQTHAHMSTCMSTCMTQTHAHMSNVEWAGAVMHPAMHFPPPARRPRRSLCRTSPRAAGSGRSWTAAACCPGSA